MNSDLPVRLREVFAGADYTIDGVRGRLGDTAARALSREEIVPALRATGDGDALATLIRLFWLQVPVPSDRARRVLPVDELAACGLVDRDGERVRAAVHIQPWDDLGYVVSDLKVRPGDPPLRPDHVVGAGGASANLAQLVTRDKVESAFDLGTGCGVQVLHLAGRAGSVTASDVNPRALELARMSWALSGVEGVEALQGSLFEPVADRRFDLIVTNPPFVISPSARLTYREAGLPGDGLSREIVLRAPDRLNPGGRCHLLANWLHVRGADWRDRVGGWLAEGGCDGWVVQRDVQDPAEYVELWLRDSCDQGTPEYRRRYDEWLAWFDELDVTGVGFGWITLHAAGSLDPVVRVEELRQRVELPVGGYVDDVLTAMGTAHRIGDEELLAARPRTAEGVVEERSGQPGAEDPERITLRQTRHLMRSVQVGTVEASLAGVCDGTLPLRPLLEAIAELTEEDPGELTARAPEVIRSLVAEGFFIIE
ncbi:DUF7059 domain-containing protein [Rhizohabitans arisaemae]|uniref:DUF7059 domain-containing protein n=1 Tax=Rhizohabitans arisaemae TaxID=2720610 RepID=UPI0024B116C7|nr:methyltransferase [Rhizohabitans arisaemae]